MSYTLETYEWDSTWIEQSNNNTSKRVLYIGDSISCGTRTLANKISNGEILFDGFGTSKSLDNPYYFDSLLLFTKQVNNRDAVIFNNGLHGWHLSEDEYERLYEEFLDKLLNQFRDVPVIPVLTTFATNEMYHNNRVIVRNEIVRKMATAKNLDIIDLYTVSEKNKNLLCDDGVHFVDDGYKLLAEEVLNILKKHI